MRVLHFYSSMRQQQQTGTWAFLGSIEKEVEVVHILADGENDYPVELAKRWGIEDLVIIEQDKVPTRLDLEEIIACPRLACIFPYAVRFYPVTRLSVWRQSFPYGLGFVKFRKEAQEAVPSSKWRDTGTFRALDRRIEKPMIERLGPMHLHERFILHNHGTGRVLVD
jgi:hypothetical protein